MHIRTRMMLTATVLVTSGLLVLTVKGHVQAAAGTDAGLHAKSSKSTASRAASKPATQSSYQDSKRNPLIVEAMAEGVAKGIPGILLQTYKDGVVQHYTAGKVSIYADRSMQSNFHFRIGSVTKTFVSVTMLQLVGEGKVSLNDTVDKWLPGVVQGNGYDGQQITIRQLLNHTSGIASYTDELFMQKVYENRFKSFTSEELVQEGLRQKPLFTPGTQASYSNTNYIVAAMIIEKVTGDTYAKQIEERIIKPLKLKNTSIPGTSTKLPKPHARGYYQLKSGGPLQDFTELNATSAHASGGMISTADDLNRFISALLSGKLLKPEQMKQLLDTVEFQDQSKYGLGLLQVTLPNGMQLWGHTGGIHGFKTFTFATMDGKHVATMSMNYHGKDLENVITEMIVNVYDAEFTLTPSG
ncbi:beta-lactamase family protein [Paenibacillus sp. SC116]|uniref:serine hydrolase domain-containing protein n=1 Tax=Paenibacillus sp. SC116 TaxID=2968986 RepID=UPI00215B26E3|nr:serine hydrolase domain-containing protein [Paenibacillus sp. SC116]MCR8842316.1 beta-lactamase family protein [Paenibacillus sp. SC116]